MDEPLRIIAEQEGVFLYREALRAGYKDAQVQAKRRSGEWHRVRHGAYCFGDVWATLTPEERHLVLAHAVRRTTPGPIAFSHVTALVAHGIAVWDASLDVAHVTRLDDGPARRLRDVRHHVAEWPDHEYARVNGLLVTSPARALLEAGTFLSVESGLVSFDSAVWKKMCTLEELKDLFDQRCNHWPGSQKLHVVTRLATGRSETPGESRSMYMFWRHGIPKPEQQVPVYDGGHLIAILDFVWRRHRTFGEFDGMRKYFRDRRPDQSIEDVVVSEKKREDLVRRVTDMGCVRIIWNDFNRPAITTANIRTMIQRRAA
jgi:hypothetical protein